MLFLLLCASLTALVLMAAGLVSYARNSLEKETLQGLAHTAEITAALIRKASPDTQEAAEGLLSVLQADPRVRSAVLYDASGAYSAGYYRTDVPKDSISRSPLSTAPPRKSRFQKARLEVLKAVPLLGGSVWTLAIGGDTEDLRKRQAAFMHVAFGLGVAALCIGMLFARWLLRDVIQPVLALSQTARQVSETHDYSLRLLTGRRDELGQLINDFNTMLGTIQKRNQELLLHRQSPEQHKEG